MCNWAKLPSLWRGLRKATEVSNCDWKSCNFSAADSYCQNPIPGSTICIEGPAMIAVSWLLPFRNAWCWPLSLYSSFPPRSTQATCSCGFFSGPKLTLFHLSEAPASEAPSAQLWGDTHAWVNCVVHVSGVEGTLVSRDPWHQFISI